MYISICAASHASTMEQLTTSYRFQIAARGFFPAHNSCPPMSLYSTVAIERQSQDVISKFGLQAGETAIFVFGGLRAEGEPPEMDLLGQRFLNTGQFWKAWISRSNYKGRWREMV